MATEDFTTLREFISELEKLSENGRNDNLRVVLKNNDEECYDLNWYGIDYVYPIEEIEENNLIHGEKCLMIEV